ncbi:MAG: hypothetical protein PVG20_08685 [Thioalkalispiraceae bacterium]|jgi:hypothetical protein
MFFTSHQNKIIERNELWYIETPTGYEGPFDTRYEARKYLSLCKRADVARVEFAGCEDSL